MDFFLSKLIFVIHPLKPIMLLRFLGTRETKIILKKNIYDRAIFSCDPHVKNSVII